MELIAFCYECSLLPSASFNLCNVIVVSCAFCSYIFDFLSMDYEYADSLCFICKMFACEHVMADDIAINVSLEYKMSILNR